MRKMFPKEDIKRFQADILSLIKKKDNRYNIIQDPEDSDKLLLREDSKEIGHITASYEEDSHTCHISWLVIEEGYKRRGLGKLLLIYGMLQAKIDHADLEKFTLDDDSDESKSMGNNIYNKVGFVGDVSHIETSATASLYGPEKEAFFPNFLVRALQMTGLSKSYKDMYKNAEKGQVNNRVLRQSRHAMGGQERSKAPPKN